MATSQTEVEFLYAASEKISDIKYLRNADPNVVALCVVEELPERSKQADFGLESTGMIDKMSVCFDFDLSSSATAKIDVVQSYVRPANAWVKAPEDAKEAMLLLSRGLIRRPVL